MWEYLMGGALIAGGAYLHAASTGRFNDTEANREYWSKLRTQYPRVMRFGPLCLVAIGVLRIAFALGS